MGRLRRLLIVTIVVLFLVTFGASLIVIGSAGVLGDAAIISATDGLVLLVLNATSLGALVVLSLIMWFGGRVRGRQDREMRQLMSTGQNSPRETLAAGTVLSPTVTCPRCGVEVPITTTSCQNCGLARTVPPTG